MRLGRYTLQRRVGAGGMAEVWKAVFRGPAGFEKDVAIKRILPKLAADQQFIRMFVAEANLVARLVHPNIVQVFDFGVAEAADGLPQDLPEYFLALEYVDGQNLSSLVRRIRESGRRLGEDLALHIAAEAAKALAFAHSWATGPDGKAMAIVHCDISPHNILLSYNGEVRVTDFGIAQLGDAVARTEDEGTLRGKLAYFSPEQAAGKPLDARSDLFSLGLVLWELVTLRRLFDGTTSSEVLDRIRGFTGLTTAQEAEIPERLRGLLGRALQPDRDHRYPDAIQMEAALTWELGLGGATRARTALAALMQELYDEDRRRDATAPPEPTADLLTGRIDLPEPGPGATELFRDYTGTATRVARRQTNPSFTYTIASPDPEPTVDPPLEPTVLAPEAAAASPSPSPSGPPPVPPSRLAVPPSLPTLPSLMSVEDKPRLDSAFKASRRVRVLPLLGLLLAGLAGWRLAAGYLPDPAPAETQIPSAPATAESTAAPAVQSSAPQPSSTPSPPVLVSITPTPTVVRVHHHGSAPGSTPARAPLPTPRAQTLSSADTRKSGWLTVLADPWVEVWVDGTRIAAETPMKRHLLAAGSHRIRVLNPGAGYKGEETVEIEPDRESRLFVDVSRRKIRVEE